MTRSALVTGATSGLGLSVARKLIDQGWKVTGLGRRDIQSPSNRLRFAKVDFARLSTIREICWPDHDVFDLFVMNAGVGTYAPGAGSRCSSFDGYELRFQVNYLAHYLLFHKLSKMEKLSKNCACVGIVTDDCRVPDFEDPNMLHSYDPRSAYARSKGGLGMLNMDIFEGVYAPAMGRATVCNPGAYIPTGMDRPGRPRVTTMTDAVARVERSIATVVDGVAARADFAKLPARAQREATRKRLRQCADGLLQGVRLSGELT